MWITSLVTIKTGLALALFSYIKILFISFSHIMAYFPNHVGFQVPSLVGQSAHSLPDQFHYPFESHQLHQLPSTDLQEFTPTKYCETVEQVPTQTRRNRGRSARTKATDGKKLKGNAENNKHNANENPSTEYIHVRARRGQATDSHSLAERVRREKISERMQTLQSLVPGCDQVAGKALKLDQIITYIQSLQTQVQYLSMKLASIYSIHDDEMCQDQTHEETGFKAEDIPSQPTMTETAFRDLQLENSNLLQQIQTLFSQDGFDEVQPWDVEDQTQDVINFCSYESTCNLY